MTITTDQYQALYKLDKWYSKYKHQIIEISGVVGTGIWDVIQSFIELENLDKREVMYLSYNQKQVLELAFKQYHAYYINSIIYKYTRYVDFSTIPVINKDSKCMEYEWKKEVRKKVDPKYKLMIVFDSLLINESTLRDLSSFGLPIIMIRDPMLIPAPDTCTFLRDPNIILSEPHPDYIKNPITYFTYKILMGERLKIGNYDNVSIISRKQMNLYNLKSSNMNITLSNDLRNEVNDIYRNNILNTKTKVNILNERLIVMNNMYNHKIVNSDEKRVKLFLTRGLVGNITKINRHAPITKYVPVEFKPEFYHDPFDDLVLDRHYLNHLNGNSRQIIPDETMLCEYAYALTPQLARLSHWDKVTLIIDNNEDDEFQRRLLYTAFTRARRNLTIVI